MVSEATTCIVSFVEGCVTLKVGAVVNDPVGVRVTTSKLCNSRNRVTPYI